MSGLCRRWLSCRWPAGLWLAVLLAGIAQSAAAAPGYYALKPQRIGADTYVFVGKRAPLTFDNHGNVVNTGFIVTNKGVVVIDTGPSRLYGEAMRAAIARITDQPVTQVYITHADPVHFLGNNAFEDVPIAALPGTVATIRRSGHELASYLYDRVGAAMRGTSAVVPEPLAHMPQRVTLGEHHIRLIGLQGNTDSDLMVFDETTGVLFAGDLVFYQRAAATANADLDKWRAALDAIAPLPFKSLVPGHGPVAHDAAPVEQTRAYLEWLGQRFRAAANRGESEADVMFDPLPPRWTRLAVEPAEYRRSVTHLYPDIERDALSQSRP